jgi:D-glycero-D-manno-heptose 1,7-bisphosphate phosphatase
MTDEPSAARPAVFLDRDGVINRPVVRGGRPYPPGSVDELELYPDAAASLSGLRAAGFTLVVVTNQPDVARRLQRAEIVHELNRELCRRIQVAAVYVCFHDDSDRCKCRKPAPGLLLRAAEDLRLDLGRSFMVGDRWRDVEAGRRAGCRTVYIDRGYSEASPSCPDVVTTGLAEAASWIQNRRYGKPDGGAGFTGE